MFGSPSKNRSSSWPPQGKYGTPPVSLKLQTESIHKKPWWHIYIYMYIYHYIPRSSKGCVSWMIRGAYTPPLRLQTAPELEDAGVKWQAKVIYKWKTCLVNAGKIHVVVIVNLQLLKFSLVLWNLMRTSFSGDLHQLLRLHQPNHGVTWRKFPHHVFELHSLKRSQQFCPSK